MVYPPCAKLEKSAAYSAISSARLDVAGSDVAAGLDANGAGHHALHLHFTAAMMGAPEATGLIEQVQRQNDVCVYLKGSHGGDR